MIKHKYSVGDKVMTLYWGSGEIIELGTSRVDSIDIPSYWIRFSGEIHPDGYARNVLESSIEYKIYTMRDALSIKTDIDVMNLPRRVYFDCAETMLSIMSKFGQCHVSAFVNPDDKFIQT